MKLVDEFNSPEGGVDIFLISTRAGGVGLNLTAANRVSWVLLLLESRANLAQSAGRHLRP